MAVELGGEHIRINAVAPSTVDTPMIRSAVESDDPSGYIQELRNFAVGVRL